LTLLLKRTALLSERVILKVFADLYAVQGPDAKIADINVHKPNPLPGSTQTAMASNADHGPFIFPPLNFGSAPGTSIEVSSESTPDTMLKKPGPSKKITKMRPGSSITAR
jgi:hypothetical protein